MGSKNMSEEQLGHMLDVPIGPYVLTQMIILASLTAFKVGLGEISFWEKCLQVFAW